MPLGLAVLIGQAVATALGYGSEATRLHKALGAALAVLVVAVTVLGVIDKLERYRPGAEPAHIAYMRATGDAETLYLTSPHDMNIRLQSGLPQLISWKTHPYKDVEVLEWYRRYQLAERVFRGAAIDCTVLAEAIEGYGVTHLLIDDPVRAATCGEATPIFEGETARIYRLTR